MMCLSRLLVFVAAALVAVANGVADEPLLGANGPGGAVLQQPHGLMLGEPAAFQEVTDAGRPFSELQPYPATPYAGHPYPNQPISFQTCAEPVYDCCDQCGGEVCRCGDVNYRSGWTLGFDIAALHSNTIGVAGEDASWFDDAGAAARISLGYEWYSGFGIRAQSWGYSVDGIVQRTTISLGQQPNLPLTYFPIYAKLADYLEIEAGTFYFDFYKAVVSRHGELLLGAGPASGRLSFYFPASSTLREYHGGGVSVFGQGLYPFYSRHRWHLALVGQARLALLSGEWEDIGGNSLDELSQSMSILELGTGLELRRRSGRRADHYWFVRTMAEFQQWTSDRMSPLGGDTLGLDGTSVCFGLGW
jgi:hypothetical protein